MMTVTMVLYLRLHIECSNSSMMHRSEKYGGVTLEHYLFWKNIEYVNKQSITLVQYGNDISLSMPLAHEYFYVCLCNISPYCMLTHAISTVECQLSEHTDTERCLDS